MEVTREIEVESDPGEVWEAITESDWLGEGTEIAPEPGGDVVTGDRSGWVEEYEPGERLTIWWSGDGMESSRVQFELEVTSTGTRLTVTESLPLVALEAELPSGPVMLAA